MLVGGELAYFSVCNKINRTLCSINACYRLPNPVHASVFAGGVFHTALILWVVLVPGILVKVLIVIVASRAFKMLLLPQ